MAIEIIGLSSYIYDINRPDIIHDINHPDIIHDINRPDMPWYHTWYQSPWYHTWYQSPWYHTWYQSPWYHTWYRLSSTGEEDPVSREGRLDEGTHRRQTPGALPQVGGKVARVHRQLHGPVQPRRTIGRSSANKRVLKNSTVISLTLEVLSLVRGWLWKFFDFSAGIFSR